MLLLIFVSLVFTSCLCSELTLPVCSEGQNLSFTAPVSILENITETGDELQVRFYGKNVACRGIPYELMGVDQVRNYTRLDINGNDAVLYFIDLLDNTSTPAEFCFHVDTVSETIVGLTMCLPPELPGFEDMVLAAGSCTSILAIVTMFVIFFKDRKTIKLHRKTLMAHSGCLLGTHVLVVLSRIADLERDGWPNDVCTTIAVLLQYFVLAALSWLAVICFDIFRKFWGITPLRTFTSDHRLFSAYSMCGWGIPLIPVIIGNVAEFEATADTFPIKPNYGNGFCSINGFEARLYYLYVPMSILLICNVVFYILTLKSIAATRRETDTVLNISSTGFQKFSLYVKLFLIMGLLWIVEVISWICTDYFQVDRRYLIAADFVTSLQGALIFVAFVFKNDNLRQVAGRRLTSWLRRSSSLSATSTTTS